MPTYAPSVSCSQTRWSGGSRRPSRSCRADTHSAVTDPRGPYSITLLTPLPLLPCRWHTRQCAAPLRESLQGPVASSVRSPWGARSGGLLARHSSRDLLVPVPVAGECRGSDFVPPLGREVREGGLGELHALRVLGPEDPVVERHHASSESTAVAGHVGHRAARPRPPAARRSSSFGAGAGTPSSRTASGSAPTV